MMRDVLAYIGAIFVAWHCAGAIKCIVEGVVLSKRETEWGEWK